MNQREDTNSEGALIYHFGLLCRGIVPEKPSSDVVLRRAERSRIEPTLTITSAIVEASVSDFFGS